MKKLSLYLALIASMMALEKSRSKVLKELLPVNNNKRSKVQRKRLRKDDANQTAADQNTPNQTPASGDPADANTAAIENCRVHTADFTKCKRCALGFSADVAQTKCVSNCQTEKSATTEGLCKTCKNGFHLTVSSKCVAYIPDCVEYEYKDLQNKCKKCRETFILSDDQFACIEPIVYCNVGGTKNEGQENNMCNKCVTGYIPSADKLFCQQPPATPAPPNPIPSPVPPHCPQGYKVIKKQPDADNLFDKYICESLCANPDEFPCKVCKPPSILLAYPQICYLPIPIPVDPTPVNPTPNNFVIPHCVKYNGNNCLECLNPFKGVSECTKQCQNPFTLTTQCKVGNNGSQIYKLDSKGKCVPQILNCSQQEDTLYCKKCCDGFTLSEDKRQCCSFTESLVTNQNQNTTPDSNNDTQPTGGKTLTPPVQPTGTNRRLNANNVSKKIRKAKQSLKL